MPWGDCGGMATWRTCLIPVIRKRCLSRCSRVQTYGSSSWIGRTHLSGSRLRAGSSGSCETSHGSTVMTGHSRTISAFSTGRAAADFSRQGRMPRLTPSSGRPSPPHRRSTPVATAPNKQKAPHGVSSRGATQGLRQARRYLRRAFCFLEEQANRVSPTMNFLILNTRRLSIWHVLRPWLARARVACVSRQRQMVEKALFWDWIANPVGQDKRSGARLYLTPCLHILFLVLFAQLYGAQKFALLW